MRRVARITAVLLAITAAHPELGRAGVNDKARSAALSLGSSRISAPRSARRSSPPADRIAVDRAQFGAPIPKAFIGFSFEYNHVLDYTGTNPGTINPILVRLIKNLVPGGGAMLRIGGDSTDRTWWPIDTVPQPPGVTYSLSRSWLATLGALARDTDGHLILGINLKAKSTTIAAAEASAMIDQLGPTRIDALEIGNEPNLYPNAWYGIPAGTSRGQATKEKFAVYLNDFSQFQSALPPLPLAGPAIGARSRWLGPNLADLLAAEPTLGPVTTHSYPLSNCVFDPTSPEYASVPNLLSLHATRGLARAIAPSAVLAHQYGRTLRVDELNAVTCGGRRGVSNTFASALWMLDTLFQLASVGVGGVNIHTWTGAVPNETFTFQQNAGQWMATVRPAYYGLLAFARIAPRGSRLLRVRTSNDPDLRCWATLAPDRRLRVVVINDALTRSHTVLIRPPHAAGTAKLEWLRAGSADATAGTTLAGQSFGAHTATGALSGRVRQTTMANASVYKVRLPSASAAIMTIGRGT